MGVRQPRLTHTAKGSAGERTHPLPATRARHDGIGCEQRPVGAREENRTPDLLITSEPLCRLSYPGAKGEISRRPWAVRQPELFVGEHCGWSANAPPSTIDLGVERRGDGGRWGWATRGQIRWLATTHRTSTARPPRPTPCARRRSRSTPSTSTASCCRGIARPSNSSAGRRPRWSARSRRSSPTTSSTRCSKCATASSPAQTSSPSSTAPSRLTAASATSSPAPASCVTTPGSRPRSSGSPSTSPRSTKRPRRSLVPRRSGARCCRAPRTRSRSSMRTGACARRPASSPTCSATSSTGGRAARDSTSSTPTTSRAPPACSPSCSTTPARPSPRYCARATPRGIGSSSSTPPSTASTIR